MRECELTKMSRAALNQNQMNRPMACGREETLMRKIALALLAGAGFALINTAPAAAFAPDHPFCLIGDGHPIPGDCSYDSYGQCQATASGQRLFCNLNPYFVPGGYPRGHRGRVHQPDYYPNY
jgi:hypothetical protein